MSTSGPTRAAGCRCRWSCTASASSARYSPRRFVELKLSAPPATTTHFSLAEGVRVDYEQSVDVAAAANAFAPYDLPPSLAGLSSRDGAGPGRRRRLRARPDHLDRFAAARPGRWAAAAATSRSRQRQDHRCWDLGAGRSCGLLITPYRGRGGTFLLAGTVTSETLQRAAAELLERQ